VDWCVTWMLDKNAAISEGLALDALSCCKDDDGLIDKIWETVQRDNLDSSVLLLEAKADVTSLCLRGC